MRDARGSLPAAKACRQFERPGVGDLVRVKFEGLEVMDATVCWVQGHIAGPGLDRPLHAAVLDLLVERLAGS